MVKLEPVPWGPWPLTVAAQLRWALADGARCRGGEQEFVRVGYYVNNEYPEEETALRAEPPKAPIIEK